MAAHQPIKRRRLRPDERKKEILDAAYQLVLANGIATLTMYKVAKEAGASKALLYSYYPNLTGLLQALYKRELINLQSQQLDALTTPHQFEDMVKVTEKINREHHSERQLLIKHLQADAAVRNSMARTDQESRKQVVEFLSSEITGNYDIPQDIVESAVKLILRYNEDEQLRSIKDETRLDEVWGAMIVGAMQELEKRFGEQVGKQAIGKQINKARK
jgi:AcrR family transcriptional regulator